MRILFLVIFLVTQCCMASPYPVVTSITAQRSDIIKYYFTISIVDIGPAGDTVPAAGSYMQLEVKHVVPGFEPTIGVLSHQGRIKTDGIKTASQLAMESYYTEIITAYFSVDGNDQCIGYGTGPYPSYSPWTDTTIYGGCAAFPPANEWCKITTPELLLDHGVITLREAAENSVSQNLSVDCTTAMNVRFDLVTQDKYVYLTPSGKTEIKVNDMPAGSKVSLTQGTNQVKVSDSLSGVNTEGSYTGSSVLVMMPY
ncbi:hypothetical protein SMZ75_001645 [Cronobacter muytjensii]|uniref:MrpH family fimbial adhesin n=1 Tax=Cronobacter muytjensii TaxID=413501 RepID=UPI001588114B|nr:hypothetical protein [Cronobacter muytjensii]ELY4518898.1 hypothetical protein [Cronobacter muytjensii]ELY4661704.1 hypothetical protein [Cronobacter muytjensii]NUW59057.1 hypothetical protein [Cronobacter muytjensii]